MCGFCGYCLVIKNVHRVRIAISCDNVRLFDINWLQLHTFAFRKHELFCTFSNYTYRLVTTHAPLPPTICYRRQQCFTLNQLNFYNIFVLHPTTTG